ncbi:MAG: carboxymuconolactone decarboxylase family protein [Deltaproteobacteria bacterium]|nr:carboxymuconolactone decarboxylase family protein [Deltaproteobacteria bacterium]
MSLPKPYVKFKDEFPAIHEDLERLGQHVREYGPLSTRDFHLVKLGLAFATESRGGVKSQVRRALEDGFTVEEIKHAALLCLPTIPFASMVASLGWVEEVLGERAMETK